MRDQKWQFMYAVPTAGGSEDIKVVYPKSKEMVEKNRAVCKEKGYRVVSVKKLYPFSTMKHQHDFDHVSNICFNRMYDIENGEPEAYEGEYDKLAEAKEKADEFFLLPLPVAWIPWEDHQKATELVAWSVNARQEACIKAGRYDLVSACAE